MIPAARSALMSRGIGNGLRAVMGVVIKPGQMTLTSTPLGRRRPRRPSPQTRIAALLAQ